MDYKINGASLNINGRSFIDQIIEAEDGVLKEENVDGGVTLSADTTVVRTSGDQTIGGNKTFNGTVTINNEIIHNHTTFSTVDGIIEQNKDNTLNDLADYGNYGVYNEGLGLGVRYRGIINKAGTDKFVVFNNCTSQPVSELETGTFDMATVLVKDATLPDECVNKRVFDAGQALKLSLTGGTMSGDLDLSDNDINNLSDIDLRAATFRRSDNILSAHMKFSTGSNLDIDNYAGGNGAVIRMITGKVGGSYPGTLPRMLINPDNVTITNSDLIVDNLSSFSGDMNLNNNDIHDIKELRFDRVTDSVEAGRIGFDASEATQLNINNYSGTGSVAISTGQTGGAYSGNLERIKVVGRDAEILNIETLTSNADNNVFTNGATFNADVDLDDNKILNLGTCTTSTDGANKGYVDTGLAGKLNLSGGTMTGDIMLDDNKLRFETIHAENIYLNNDNAEYRIGTQTSTTYIRTPNLAIYSGGEHTSSGPGSGGTQIMRVSGSELLLPGDVNLSDAGKLINMIDPTAAQDGATKAYVDAASDLSGVEMISFEGTTGSKLQFYGPDCEYCIGIASYEIYINTARVFKVTREGSNTQIETDINDNVSIPNGDLIMNTNKITGLADCTAAQDAATKAYVDSTLFGVTTANQIAGNLAATGTLANYGASWEPTIVPGVYKLEMSLNLSDGGTSAGSVNNSALRFGTSSSVSGTSIAVSTVAKQMQTFQTDGTTGRSINCNLSYVFTQPVVTGVITLSAVAQTAGGAAAFNYIRTFSLTRLS